MLPAPGAALACLLAGAAMAQPEPGAPPPPPAPAMPLALHKPMPVTAAQLADPPAEDWLSFRRTLNGWAYSPLTQITPRNVKGLKLVWSRPLTDGGYEGVPLVHAG